MLTHTHVKTSINIRSDAAMYSFMSSYFSKKINLNYSICTVYWVFCSQFLSHSFFRFFFSFIRSFSLSPLMISNIFFWEFCTYYHMPARNEAEAKEKKNIQFQFRVCEKFIWHVFSFRFFLSALAHTHTFLCVKKERIPNNLQFVLLIFGWTFFYTIRFSDWFGKFKE